VHTYAFSALTLVANLVSGIVTARVLGPAGRGETVAIAMLAQNVGFVFAFGCGQAVSYRYAREPGTGRDLITSWSVMLLPLSLVAIAVGELAVPVLFAAQGSDVVDLGRIYLVTVVLVLYAELTYGLLNGQGDYLFANIVRFAQPGLAAIVQVVLWQLDALTVVSSLATAAGCTLLVQAVAMARAARNAHGFGLLDLPLAIQTLWYGFRGHGVVLASAANQRLDLLIMPAFLAPGAIGLYSIAANLSLIVNALTTNFSAIVLPAAARDAVGAHRTILRALQGTLAIAAVMAIFLELLARPALTFIYGDEFGEATTALRILLPGTVLLAGSSILIAGLYAVNRPTIATVTQIGGLLVTVVGLLLFLSTGGIVAAAIVSTSAYAAVFAAALVAYKRVAGLTWRSFTSVSRAVPGAVGL
jgi:O-antigen/teichoic acid export membrane protein